MNNKNKKVLDIISHMTVEEKLLCLHGQKQDKYRANQAGFVHGIPRFHIPDVFICDGESGINTNWDATAFPAKVGLAASFDKKTAYEYGEALGEEAKAMGMHLLLSPRVNIVRDYAAEAEKTNGGNFQTYGEDPVLNGVLGAEETKGIQKDQQCIANAKQLFGSSTGAAQGAGNVLMDEQTMREIYLRPFNYLYEAGIGSSMSNYNQVNGQWTYESELAHKTIARDEYGFDGPVLCDWGCLYNENAIINGVTLEMSGGDDYGKGSENSLYGKKLLDAVYDETQPVSMEDIDRAVYYYLNMLDRFHMLDEEQRIPGALPEDIRIKHQETAEKIAEKTAVLLKNENNILPVFPEKEKILFVGIGAASQIMPVFKEASFGFSDRKTGTYQILKEQYPDRISYAAGIDISGEIIPSEFLYPEKDTDVHGLKRFTAGMHFAFGSIKNIPEAGEDTVIDEIIHYEKDTVLPVLSKENDTIEEPKNYYWHGYLCPEETGIYRLNLETYIPGQKEFEATGCTGPDLYVPFGGNLYIRKPGEESFEVTGRGSRIILNGGAVPNSSLFTTKDGWNITGGEIFLEAGEYYEIFMNQPVIYRTPVSMRLTWRTPSMKEQQLDEAVSKAVNADKVIVFVWQNSPNPELKLQEGQDELIHRITSVNENTAVVLNTGDPVALPWKDSVKAILEMWYSGQEGSRATANILTGKVSPGGKLPVTFPIRLEDTPARDPIHPERYAEPGQIRGKDAVQTSVAEFTEGIMVGYRWFDDQKKEVHYPFGHGLSYTSFDYHDLKIRKTKDGYDVIFMLSNTGKVSGEEVPQLYIGRPETELNRIPCAVNQLCDFERVCLDPGETKQMILHLRDEMLKSYDSINHQWETLPGPRPLRIGSSSRDIRLEGKI